MFYAEIDTWSYSFTAFGRTEDEVKNTLIRAWKKHIKQCNGGDPAYILELLEDVNILPVKAGIVYRDGEEF